MGDINKIAVLYGGSSSEREISIQSGEGVYKAIIELGFVADLIDINDLEDLSELRVFDFIFIALHGFEGEGGKLQKDLDDLNILYSGSSSKCCKNTWNKKLTKEILEQNNIKFSSITGLGLGFMLPKTNAKLLTNDRNDNFYLSGYGVHALTGLNVSLFKNFFIQTEFKGGFTSLPSIRTTTNKSDTASQNFFYIQYNLVFGYLWNF